MRRFTVLRLTILLTVTNILLTSGCHTQSTSRQHANDQKPVLDSSLIYSVKPDLRKCAWPACGGWYLMKVNELAPLENLNQTPAVTAEPLYISSMNYKALSLTPAQITEIETKMRTGRVLLQGTTINESIRAAASTTITQTIFAPLTAWTSETNNEPAGVYVKIIRSGIVCITTPCPYYKAQLLNSNVDTNIDEVDFENAALNDEQQALATNELENSSVLISGVSFETSGQAGAGKGIRATNLFFQFPATKK